jgi:general secretion pathway protein F
VPQFRYTAVRATGKPVRGVLEAASAAAVADHLYGQGQLLLKAVEVGRNGRLGELLHADFSIRRGLSKSTLASFTRELSVMLSAGQDIDRALVFLVEASDDKRARRTIEDLRNQVRGGKSLAASMGEHPQIFSSLYISLVRAGEASGQLAATLARLADLLERDSRLAASLHSALIYPALLALASVGTIVLLLTQVLPQFTPMFEQAGAKLPELTRFLLQLGDVVERDGAWVLLAGLCLILVLYRSLREPGPRLMVDRLVLRVPLVGTLLRRAEAARMTRTLGTLLSNGVSLVSALAISRGVLRNRVATKIVDAAATQIKAGAHLATSLGVGRFFPVQTIHLLQLGEETGKLGEMALRAADIHDDQVHQSVTRLVALLVPAITIFMGVVVAGIVGSLLVAMLSLNDLAV